MGGEIYEMGCSPYYHWGRSGLLERESLMGCCVMAVGRLVVGVDEPVASGVDEQESGDNN